MIGKWKKRAGRRNTMLCVNGEHCGGPGREQRVGWGRRTLWDGARKVKGGNYMKSSEYNAKNFEFYASNIDF